MYSESMTIGRFDPELASAIGAEARRQEQHIELIASENYASPRVLEAQGSVLTNKYAEGYPGKRYYGGCEHVDTVEQLAIDRARRVFGADFANVQPHSGSQANAAAFLALINPGDTFMGMSLDHGGHLTHGSKVNFSGRLFRVASYGLKADDGRIDYDQMEQLALAEKPKLIVAGFSAYSRHLDFARFRRVADAVGAYLVVDMAHVAGLVATGLSPNPVPYADVVTSTTHKTLRGPRGGLILARSNPEIEKKLNSLVFPGTQGGPLMHVIAAKAVALHEALQPAFRTYAGAVVENAKILAATLVEAGLEIVSGGTDSHLMLVDLRPLGITGRDGEASLERAGITCNKNGIPFDPQKPTVTSGIRLGSPAATTRGFGPEEFRTVGQYIVEVLRGLALRPGDNGATEAGVRKKARELCARFPIYEELGVDHERDR
jgi:glycine hydroxymethyltransferase